MRPGPSRVAGAVAVVALVVLALPVVALVARAPWSTLWAELTRPRALTALRLSLVVSVAATGLAVALGLPVAWLLAEGRLRGRRVVRAVVLMPLVLPPVVAGVALLSAFGRRGVLGRPLDAWFGITLPFTTAGAVLAATFVAMPFFVIAAEAALRDRDRRVEEAARTLGASRSRVFWRVTVPLARPALLAGAALSWARALGEFGATVTFAGNVEGRTSTVPLEVYLLLDGADADAALALSLVLLAVSLAVLLGLRDRWLRVR